MAQVTPFKISVLKILFGSISVFMIGLVIVTSVRSDMFHLPDAVLKEPWFWTTLVDFYFNITIISAWMIYKEDSVIRAVLWLLAFVSLGSIATAFYVFLQLSRWRPGDSFEKVLLRS